MHTCGATAVRCSSTRYSEASVRGGTWFCVDGQIGLERCTVFDLTTLGDAPKESFANDWSGSEGEIEWPEGGPCWRSGMSSERPVGRLACLIGGKDVEVGEKASAAERLLPGRGGVCTAVATAGAT